MLIDSKANLNQTPCRDDCKEICTGCCWYRAIPLCNAWLDCPKCTIKDNGPCLYIYHDLQGIGTASEPCAPCCDCTNDLDDTGCENCNCGCWYNAQSPGGVNHERCSAGHGLFDKSDDTYSCCDLKCGSPTGYCTPLAYSGCHGHCVFGYPDGCWDERCAGFGEYSCRGLRPVYKYKGQCWTLQRAAPPSAGDGHEIGATDGPCGVAGSSNYGHCDEGGWEEIPGPPSFCKNDLVCKTKDGGTFTCGCCDNCEPEIVQWCAWGADLITTDYYCWDHNDQGGFGYCSDPAVDKECESCNDCCDGGGGDPPTCSSDCFDNCPAGERCCFPDGPGACFCLDENEDCNPDFPCNLSGDCCNQEIEQTHSLNVNVLINSAFSKGGFQGCSGGCQDNAPEAFGGKSVDILLSSGGNAADFVCGFPNEHRLQCSGNDMCGAQPPTPSNAPVNGPEIRCVSNCQHIDLQCCDQSGLGNDEPRRCITDYLECGNGNIPHQNNLGCVVAGCPKAFTSFVDRHLALNMAVDFTVQCSQASGGTFRILERGVFHAPRIKIGHTCAWKTDDGEDLYGCPDDWGCCGPAGTQLSVAPGSFSVGAEGAMPLPGWYYGEVRFITNDHGDCTGSVFMHVTFQPDSQPGFNYLPISFTSGCSGVKHPCAGGSGVYQYFDWARAMGQGEGWDITTAQRVRQNCGIQPPPIFDPALSPIVDEVKSRYKATGRTAFAALELPSVVTLLQMSFANRGACGNSPPIGYSKSYETKGFGGCDLGAATHPCSMCTDTVVNLDAVGGWNVGSIQAYGKMSYS